MFRLIAINCLPTSPGELSEREVTSPSNLKVVGALYEFKKQLDGEVVTKSPASSVVNRGFDPRLS
jgi:hypothetical protein